MAFPHSHLNDGDDDSDLRLASSAHSHLRAFAPDGEKLALHHDSDKLVEKCDVVAGMESMPNSQEAQGCHLFRIHSGPHWEIAIGT